MSAATAIRYLLANNATLIAQVPATKIMAGAIPLNTALPAISVMEISNVPRNNVGMNETNILETCRVQVTVLAKTYPTQKSILELVRKACPNQRGSIGGVEVDSILPDSAGPDMYDDAAVIYMQSRDFIVKFASSRV
ncbi:MAG: hypothetical protein WC710_14985 [Gallionella sp.]|jgi:hypothetical protein